MSHDFARSQRLKKESARKPVRKKSGGVPSWLWVLVGTLVGSLIMFLVYLSGVAPQLPNLTLQPSATADKPAAVTGEPATAVELTAPPKRVSPVFEFYTKLPEGGQPVTDLPPEAQPTTGVVPPTDNTQPTTVAPTTLPATTSPPAAENLDPIQQLLAEKAAAKSETVKSESAKPEPVKSEAAKPEAAKSMSNGRYLQAGVFRNKAEVEKLRARISMLGIKPNVQTITNAKGETLQKVTVGPFNSADDMSDARIILNGNGVSTIAVQ